MQTPRTACFNIGRPEAVETFFVLWYYTRDPKWRDIGWEVFKAFEQHAAMGSGWAALSDVENPKKKRDDKMESFVLAETMKYLFLLFSNDDPIPLEKYVMNTEAHPLERFTCLRTGTYQDAHIMSLRSGSDARGGSNSSQSAQCPLQINLPPQPFSMAPNSVSDVDYALSTKY